MGPEIANLNFGVQF